MVEINLGMMKDLSHLCIVKLAEIYSPYAIFIYYVCLMHKSHMNMD